MNTPAPLLVKIREVDFYNTNTVYLPTTNTDLHYLFYQLLLQGNPLRRQSQRQGAHEELAARHP